MIATKEATLMMDPPAERPFSSSALFWIDQLMSILALGQAKKHLQTHLTHSQHCVLAAVPDTLDIDRLGQVPDLLLGVDRVVIAE